EPTLNSLYRDVLAHYGVVPLPSQKLTNGIEYELKRLHYDIVGSAYRPRIAALTSLVATSQILLGSDNPFIPLAETAEGAKHLDSSAADLQRIGGDNAMELLPRLRSTRDLP